MTKRMALMLAALTLVFGGIFGYKWLERKLTADYLASYQPPPVAVSAVTVRDETWERDLRATGSTVAIDEIAVSSEADGVITAIHFDSGDRVAQGELLIELDDQVEAANLRSYQARLNLARLNFERDSKMLSRKLISADQFDRSKAELDEVLALVDQTEAVIAQKQVRAPFAGRVGLRRVSVGSYLAAGDPVVTLQSLDPLFVDFSLPEQHLPEVRVGQPLTFAIKAYPDSLFSARVTAIDARVDTATRNIAVRAEAPNGEGKLLPGMFADVRLGLGAGEPALVVPESAVSYSLYGQAVFEVVERRGGDGKPALVVERRPVTTGAVRDGFVQLRGELGPGARVVVNGQNKLQSGVRVKIVNRPEHDAPLPLPPVMDAAPTGADPAPGEPPSAEPAPNAAAPSLDGADAPPSNP
ncbi:MAG: efflux RND transporter periplasmic adaptor subunit [Porticoccaceae bacterium]|jgi:RND family efflux transporter MFP subunit|nr:efflux RND transporter periplasmic adaptor subunit [Porticoccaceae bacterium]HLS98133.1 efflux RND transporter periplasmic adaptor subunit [Porticoccaceae bacterium]